MSPERRRREPFPLSWLFFRSEFVGGLAPRSFGVGRSGGAPSKLCLAVAPGADVSDREPHLRNTWRRTAGAVFESWRGEAVREDIGRRTGTSSVRSV